jgi:hypothetical protein
MFAPLHGVVAWDNDGVVLSNFKFTTEDLMLLYVIWVT